MSIWRGVMIGVLAISVALAATREVNYKAADGVTVYAEHATAKARSRGLIVLFHQASGSRAEYATIAPRLNELGFDTLAVDQRSGGNQFGTPNKTAAGVTKAVTYLDALPDLEASVKFARSELKANRVIVWGSSYSAALVFVLAANMPNDVMGVLAFSPDEYLGRPSMVRDAARKVVVPVFITSTSSEVNAARAVYDALASKDRVQFIPKGVGLHGSSVLNNALTRTEYWVAVEKFLERFK